MNENQNIDPATNPDSPINLEVKHKGIRFRYLYMGLFSILALLSLYAFQMTLDTEARLEDEKLARLKANERTAALMNGRALVDQHEGVAYIPDGKVTAVKVR